MSMTMMNDDNDVKIVSDVLDDVQSKEKTKRKNVSLLLDCFFVRICKASVIALVCEANITFELTKLLSKIRQEMLETYITRVFARNKIENYKYR